MVELVSLRKTNEVAAYVRASMDRKGDRWTVETQLRKIRALAEAKDWEVVEVYDDNAVSATKKRRAGTRWAEMLDDARAGRFSMVVAVDMDRLLRSTKDLNTLIDLGLRVVTVDGEIDLSTADGEFRATMLAALARFEARRKAEDALTAAGLVLGTVTEEYSSLAAGTVMELSVCEARHDSGDVDPAPAQLLIQPL